MIHDSQYGNHGGKTAKQYVYDYKLIRLRHPDKRVTTMSISHHVYIRLVRAFGSAAAVNVLARQYFLNAPKLARQSVSAYLREQLINHANTLLQSKGVSQ